MDNQLYEYSPIIDRPRLEWPNGARVAFWIGLNVEHYEVDKPSTSIFGGTAALQPDPLNYGLAGLRSPGRHLADDGPARQVRNSGQRGYSTPMCVSAIRASSRKASNATGRGSPMARHTRLSKPE